MRTKSILLVVLFNVLATLVILLALEGVSRLVKPVDLPDPLITDKRAHWSVNRQYDPYLFWTMRPRARMPDQNLNNLGLRGPDVHPKKSDEFRILSLGESTTFGAYVSEKETYSRLLEEEVHHVDGKLVRVINGGVPGYTLFQGFTYLRLRGLELQPDAVLVYFGFNDFLPVAFRAKRDAGFQPQTAVWTDRELFETRTKLLSRISFFFQRNSNLVRWILQSSGPDNETEIVESDEFRVPEEDRRWVFSELHRMSRDEGFKLVIIIPWYREFEKHIPLLRELATEWDDVVVVDLPAMFATLPSPRKDFFHDAVHPNSDGHRLIARAIGEQLHMRWGLQASEEGR